MYRKVKKARGSLGLTAGRARVIIVAETFSSTQVKSGLPKWKVNFWEV